MPVINILDANVANQIAAGEVIERPASVVKELVENAIDAGATRIDVEIADGGLSLIRVTDNGCGMDEADARLAIERHATSKIQNAEDLTQIVSLGFRGEALPSIAAVSHFSLLTRLPRATAGILVEVSGGQNKRVGPAGCPAGTSVTVRDLFFNTPARRKFLKTTAVEASHITDIVSRLALAFPDIAIRLMHNGRQVLVTPGGGNLKETIGSIHGAELVAQLLPVEHRGAGIVVKGYTARPAVVRKNRSHQTIFVNRRYIQSRLISRAIEDAYGTLLPPQGYPVSILAVTIDPATVDVNVHPTKSEVRFSHERDVYLAVYQAIKEALDSACLVPALEVKPERPPAPSPVVIPQELPLAATAQPPVFFGAAREEPVLTAGAKALSVRENPPVQPFAVREPREPFPELVPVAQIQNLYIIATGAAGIYIIDQHAAHERILYEQIRQKIDYTARQQLLVPRDWEVAPQEAGIMETQMAIFSALGFDIEPFGSATFRVRAVPAGLGEEDAVCVLHELLDIFKDGPVPPSLPEWQEKLAKLIACKRAVKANQHLSLAEMQALIHDLSSTATPYTCPHGRPTVIHITPEELARRFKRIT